MGFRRAAKVDLNQPQVVKELRSLGYRVDIVSQVKKLYDLVVTGRMTGTNDIRTVRVELKSEGGTLTPDESDYHNTDPYPETLLIAFSTEDILEWFHKPYLTKKHSQGKEAIYASADVESKDMTHITPLSITYEIKAKRNTRNSTTGETLSGSTMRNILTGNSIQTTGDGYSGKSKLNGTAKKK